MKIRNIITTGALVVLLGLTGGSAYAFHADSHVEDEGFAVAANATYPGTMFTYENDYDENDYAVYEGDTLSTDGSEESRLPEHILETIRTN